MYIVDNKKIEDVLEDLSIENYWDDINHVISSTYHMINVFKNTEALLTNFSPIIKTAKIATFGVVNFDTKKEKLFYDLKMARNKRYFFGINKELLKENKALLNDVRRFMDERSSENIEAGFSIYSTDYEHNYIYCAHYATLVQEEI